MLVTDQSLLNKLKKHSTSIGLKRNIRKSRPKFVVNKRDKLNIQILNFHSSILDKYKMLGNFFLEQNFRFLEFIAPVKKDRVLFNKRPKIKYITKEKIKKVVERIYQDKEKLIEDFRLKELIDQRAMLIYNEQKMNDTKEIKELLIKELNRFSKDISSTELDDRIVLYTKLNNYLNTININHKNMEYKIDKNLYLNYDSKEIKNIIKQFESIENIEFNKIDEYIQKVQNITKNIGISFNSEQKIVDKKTINKILNIKNNISINEITPIFNNSFENKILKMSENIFNVLNTKDIVNNTSKIENISLSINQTIEQQLKTIFKNIVINKEIKNIFLDELNTIFLNTSYSMESKFEEINNSITNYIDNIIVQNQNKQNFLVENKKTIQENIYNEVISKVSKLGINLHHTLKKELYKIVVKKLSKIKNINDIKIYNKVLDEIVNEFILYQDNSVSNSSIIKKYSNNTKNYNNIENIFEKFNTIQNSEYSKILNISNNIETISVRNIDILSLTKLGENIKANSTFEQKIEAVYENIIKNINSNYTIKKIDQIQKEQIFKNIENLISVENIGKFDKEYKNIVDQLTQKIELKEIIQNDKIKDLSSEKNIYNSFIQNIENLDRYLNIENKQELLKDIKNISKLTNIQEINKEYTNLISQYFTSKEIIQNSIMKDNTTQKNIYNIMIENIESIARYQSIENKQELIQNIKRISNLTNINKINEEYQNLVEKYFDSKELIKNNINEENIYNTFIENIEKLDKYLSVENKQELVQNIKNISKLTNINEINKEYEVLISQYFSQKDKIENIFIKTENIEQHIYNTILADLKDVDKYLNSEDKQELIQNIKNISKLTDVKVINKEYKNLIEQYNKEIKINIENKNINSIYENIIKELQTKQFINKISSIEKSQILKRIESVVKTNDIQLINKEYQNIIQEFSIDAIYENILDQSTNIDKQIINKKELINKITDLTKYSNITQINSFLSEFIKEHKIDTLNISHIQRDILSLTKLGDNVNITNNLDEKLELVYENIIKEIKSKGFIKQITPIQKSQILQRLEKIVKINDVEVQNKEYKNIIKEFSSNLISKNITQNSIEKLIQTNTINKESKLDLVYKDVLNEINKTSTNKYISIVNKNEILKNITKNIKLSNNSYINKEYSNIINEHKIETINIRDIHNDIFSLTKLGDSVNRTNTIEEKIELLYENIVNKIKAKEPLKKITVQQKEQIVSKLTKVIRFDSVEQINKEYKNILNQFTQNIEHKEFISKDDQIDIIYESVINSIKKVQSLKQITSAQKNQILQKVQNIVKLDSIENINKQTRNIVNEFVTKIQTQNIKNELNVDKLYKNVLNEITKSSSNKYINIINKKELLNKISNISKLSNITQINSEYTKLINQYKNENTINRFDTNISNEILNFTSLGSNVSITKNYEQKIESIYQNILKEIKVKQPHKQINTKEKSILLQKINKLVKSNSIEQIDKQYKELVDQFVYQSNTKQSTRQNIIQKLIDNSPNSYVKNETNVVLESTQKTLLGNHHRYKGEELEVTEGLVYISADEIKKKKEQKVQSDMTIIDNKIDEKEAQLRMNVQNLYEKFDDNLDELALKIFRNIKDELSMEYKRI